MVAPLEAFTARCRCDSQSQLKLVLDAIPRPALSHDLGTPPRRTAECFCVAVSFHVIRGAPKRSRGRRRCPRFQKGKTMFSFVGLKTVVTSTALFGAAMTCISPAEACGSRSCGCQCSCGTAMQAMPMDHSTPTPAAPAPEMDHSQHMTQSPSVYRYRSGYQGAVSTPRYAAPSYRSSTMRSGSSNGIIDQINANRHSFGKP